MSIEAFIWNYNNGENASFPLADVLAVFAEYTDNFDSQSGVLSVQFGDEVNSCDIYLGDKSSATGVTQGLMISRPVRALELWECVLELMNSGNVILFFSDDTTPLYATPGALAHFPTDLLDSLGKPKFVETPHAILESREF